jgi:transcriptional regulator with XRE-family HTH domain
MNELNPNDMAPQREHRRLSDAIAKRIHDLRVKKGMDHAQLGAALGQSPDVTRKAEAGQHLTSYIKLIELARVLDTTPNEILGVGWDYDVILGLLEGTLMSRGMPPGEAEALARTVLEVLDSPEVRSEGSSPRENARLLARCLIRRFFER